MNLVVPAVLPSSRKDLEEKLALLARIPLVSRVQVDVVDGRFAAPASWPYSARATKGTPSELDAMVNQGKMLPALDRIEYEMDLMCLNAERAAASWLALGATRLTFHAESIINLSHFLASVRRRFGSGSGFAPGLVSFGLALNIASDPALIEPCLSEIEYVQLMGIARIGRQGQPFDRRVFEKVRVFRNRHPKLPLQVDGGVSLERAKELVALGVSTLVVGSGILRANDPATALAAFGELKNPL